MRSIPDVGTAPESSDGSCRAGCGSGRTCHALLVKRPACGEGIWLSISSEQLLSFYIYIYVIHRKSFKFGITGSQNISDLTG